MTVTEYLETQYREHKEKGEMALRYRVVPKIVCADGFNISVQGGTHSHYCSPRETCNFYQEVECGYPSEREETLMPYCECSSDPLQTVYGYVPIDIVEEIVKKHGGISLTPPTDRQTDKGEVT